MAINTIGANQQPRVNIGQRLGEKFSGMVQGFKDEFKAGLKEFDGLDGTSDAFRGYELTVLSGLMGANIGFMMKSPTAAIIGGVLGAIGTPIVAPTIRGLGGAALGLLFS